MTLDESPIPPIADRSLRCPVCHRALVRLPGDTDTHCGRDACRVKVATLDHDLATLTDAVDAALRHSQLIRHQAPWALREALDAERAVRARLHAHRALVARVQAVSPSGGASAISGPDRHGPDLGHRSGVGQVPRFGTSQEKTRA